MASLEIIKMNGIIIENRDDVVLQALAICGIDSDLLKLPESPFNKAFGFLKFPGYHGMVTLDAYHPDPADNGLTLILLPEASFSEDAAREFFTAINNHDAKMYDLSRPFCAA